ncbi:unnamed protein product [Ostreobium quekettii]|uniref:Uncharacterized protein n=1 Tax=Ostreobium quekettii TaxID=121088 RepID=A0A8S1IVH9_9CHLO|nr:unnamed protein product [Ostreobium quekettii]
MGSLIQGDPTHKCRPFFLTSGHWKGRAVDLAQTLSQRSAPIEMDNRQRWRMAAHLAIMDWRKSPPLSTATPGHIWDLLLPKTSRWDEMMGTGCIKLIALQLVLQFSAFCMSVPSTNDSRALASVHGAVQRI